MEVPVQCRENSYYNATVANFIRTQNAHKMGTLARERRRAEMPLCSHAKADYELQDQLNVLLESREALEEMYANEVDSG